MILAGDIGGTNTRLALFETGDGLHCVAEQTYPSAQHKGLEEIVAAFRQRYSAPIRSACFGVAGPVLNGRCEATNLPWVVEADAIARQLAIPCMALLNDLEANAYGLRYLGPNDIFELQAGEPSVMGNRALVSAGTGLGEAGLFWDGRTHRPFACEGGHTDFAPRSETEVELLRFLRAEFGHVSYERVVSGMALPHLYRFFYGSSDWESALTRLRQETGAATDGAAITRSALSGRCPVCVKVVQQFITSYGAEAGNMGLKVMATGGVYLGGGIAPRIVEWLKGPSFLDAFNAKGRMEPLMRSMPVRVVLNDKTALLGAAGYALDRL